MAYRSDVRLIVTKKGYDKLSKFVQKKVKDISYNLIENCDYKTVHPNVVCMGWDSIKWYEYSDFEDVNAIMDGISFLKNNDYSVHYARIGENYDDYDEYNYDSEKDELDIYPVMLRQFDDDYVEEQLKKNDEYFRNLKDRKKKDGKELLQN